MERSLSPSVWLPDVPVPFVRQSQCPKAAKQRAHLNRRKRIRRSSYYDEKRRRRKRGRGAKRKLRVIVDPFLALHFIVKIEENFFKEYPINESLLIVLT